MLRLYSEEKDTGLKTRHYNGRDGDLKSPLQESNLAGWKPALQNKGKISRSLTIVRDNPYARLPRACARPGSG